MTGSARSVTDRDSVLYFLCRSNQYSDDESNPLPQSIRKLHITCEMYYGARDIGHRKPEDCLPYAALPTSYIKPEEKPEDNLKMSMG